LLAIVETNPSYNVYSLAAMRTLCLRVQRFPDEKHHIKAAIVRLRDDVALDGRVRRAARASVYEIDGRGLAASSLLLPPILLSLFGGALMGGLLIEGVSR